MVSFWVRDRSIAKRRIDARTKTQPPKKPALSITKKTAPRVQGAGRLGPRREAHLPPPAPRRPPGRSAPPRGRRRGGPADPLRPGLGGQAPRRQAAARRRAPPRVARAPRPARPPQVQGHAHRGQGRSRVDLRPPGAAGRARRAVGRAARRRARLPDCVLVLLRGLRRAGAPVRRRRLDVVRRRGRGARGGRRSEGAGRGDRGGAADGAAPQGRRGRAQAHAALQGDDGRRRRGSGACGRQGRVPLRGEGRGCAAGGGRGARGEVAVCSGQGAV